MNLQKSFLADALGSFERTTDPWTVESEALKRHELFGEFCEVAAVDASKSLKDLCVEPVISYCQERLLRLRAGLEFLLQYGGTARTKLLRASMDLLSLSALNSSGCHYCPPRRPNSLSWLAAMQRIFTKAFVHPFCRRSRQDPF